MFSTGTNFYTTLHHRGHITPPDQAESTAGSTEGQQNYTRTYDQNDAYIAHDSDVFEKFYDNHGATGIAQSGSPQKPIHKSDFFTSLAGKVDIAGFSKEFVRNAVIALTALTILSLIGVIVAAAVSAPAWIVVPLAINTVVYGILPLFCIIHKAYTKYAERAETSAYYKEAEITKDL